MIDHETALLAKIAEAPADPDRNGIYADWLQEQGRLDEAAIRLAWTLEDRITAFIAHVQRVLDAHPHQGFAGFRVVIVPEFGPRWCRLVNERTYTRSDGFKQVSSRSVYCFVCLKDGVTRSMGVLRAGDIHKSESWKKPARRARGSVYEVDFRSVGATAYGVRYLR